MYYDDYQDIFEFLKEGCPAHTKLIANKESGNFENHVTHDVILLNVEPVENELLKLNVNRVYEHKTSNIPNITNVDYYMNSNTHEVIDYEAISNEPYHHLNL